MAKGNWRNWSKRDGAETKKPTKYEDGYVHHINLKTEDVEVAQRRVMDLHDEGFSAFFTKGRKFYTVWSTPQKLSNMTKVKE